MFMKKYSLASMFPLQTVNSLLTNTKTMSKYLTMNCFTTLKSLWKPKGKRIKRFACKAFKKATHRWCFSCWQQSNMSSNEISNDRYLFIYSKSFNTQNSGEISDCGHGKKSSNCKKLPKMWISRGGGNKRVQMWLFVFQNETFAACTWSRRGSRWTTSHIQSA